MKKKNILIVNARYYEEIIIYYFHLISRLFFLVKLVWLK